MFRVYLPIPEDPEEPAPSGSRETSSTLAKATVLLVEDQPPLRRLAREILKHEGYSVIEANDGNQALALAKQHAGPIHVLLTDVMMPHMSGQAGRQPGANALRAARHLHVGVYWGFTGDAMDRRRVTRPGTRFLPNRSRHKPCRRKCARRLRSKVGSPLVQGAPPGGPCHVDVAGPTCGAVVPAG
jgi:two-component system cell cycle sensor histidine kinase/response regulator CckA